MSQMLMVFCPHCGEMVEHTVGFTVEEFAKKQEEGIEIGYVDYNAPFKCPHCELSYGFRGYSRTRLSILPLPCGFCGDLRTKLRCVVLNSNEFERYAFRPRKVVFVIRGLGYNDYYYSPPSCTYISALRSAIIFQITGKNFLRTSYYMKKQF